MARKLEAPADASEEEECEEGSSDEDEDTVERKGTGAEAGTSGRHVFTRIRKETSYSKLQPHEMLGQAPFKMSKERPMMKYQAWTNEWFQVYIIGESVNEFHIRFPATQEHNKEEVTEWVDKTSCRFWRGSNLGKYWKHVGDGAWEPIEPRGKAKGRARKIAKRARSSQPRSIRMSQGQTTEPSGTTRASGDGDDGFSSPRLMRTSKATTPEISDVEDEAAEGAAPHGEELSDTMDRDTRMLGSSGGRSSPDELQDKSETRRSTREPAGALEAETLLPIKNWFFNHLRELHEQQRLNREGAGTSAEAGTIQEPLASALNVSPGSKADKRSRKRHRPEAAAEGQTDSTRGKEGSSSSGSAGHVQEGSFQGPREAAGADASGSDDEGHHGQRRQPVSTREIANLLQSPWGWEKGRSRRRKGSHSGSESDEDSARSRSPSPATPVRQANGGSTHRHRSSSADGEAKPAHPQAGVTTPVGKGERHGKSAAGAGRPVSAPVQAGVKTETVRASQQQQRSASPAPKVKSTKPLSRAKEPKLTPKDRAAKAEAADARRDGSAKPRPKSEPKLNGRAKSIEVMAKPKGETLAAKAVRRPGNAADLGALKCPKLVSSGKANLSVKDAGPERLGSSKEVSQANGMPRPMSQPASGGIKAPKAGPQAGHRRLDPEGVPPQKRSAEVAAPVLMATDVFEELGAKKVKGAR